ncbi:MAG: hypothetical protein ACE5MI_06955 [Acidimicrobiia bacterium]
MDTIGVILLLLVAGVWAFFLLPALFTVRKDAPVSTTRQFSRLTARLESVQRAAADNQRLGRRQVIERRRRVLLVLILLAIASIALALWLSSRVLLGFHVVVDGVLAWYIVRLIQIRQRREGQARVVGLTTYADEEQPVRVVAHR